MLPGDRPDQRGPVLFLVLLVVVGLVVVAWGVDRTADDERRGPTPQRVPPADVPLPGFPSAPPFGEPEPEPPTTPSRPEDDGPVALPPGAGTGVLELVYDQHVDQPVAVRAATAGRLVSPCRAA